MLGRQPALAFWASAETDLVRQDDEEGKQADKNDGRHLNLQKLSIMLCVYTSILRAICQ